MTTNHRRKINYPYLPDNKEILYVDPENEYMLEAKKAASHEGCAKQKTGAVIVKDGKIVAVGTNAGITVSVCPRVLKGSKTGTDYHFCKDVCKQKGHAEAVATINAKEKGIDVNGADLYLWGHWWCCQPCWDAMISSGIKNVYLEKEAEDKFNISSSIGKIYISGQLNFAKNSIKKTYEKIAALCSNFCSNVYVPHLAGTDPIKNPEVSPHEVWKKDHREVASSDLIIAYAGKPSLGVGAELEIARTSASDIVLWWFKGDVVSRMAKGNPNIKHFIEAEDEEDLLQKIKVVLKKY